MQIFYTTTKDFTYFIINTKYERRLMGLVNILDILLSCQQSVPITLFNLYLNTFSITILFLIKKYLGKRLRIN